MSDHLETIVSLQHHLTVEKETERQLAGIPAWMRDLHDEHSRAQAEIDALHAVAQAAGQKRRAAEAGIADTQEKLKHLQQQMSLVRNQREYGALLQEIDTAKAALRRFEEEALAALEETENAELAEAGKKEAFAGLAARYQEGLARWEEEKPALRAVLATTRETIATLRASLTPALRSQFERIYERTKGEALAPLRRTERVGGPSLWHCGHCNYQVRPQVAVEIRSARALVQCESCKRLLYPEPAS
jgi:predicted  nucleic acid-binding Zn-ribbon protein